MRSRFKPSTEQRASVSAKRAQLLRPGAALELVHSFLPAHGKPAEASFTVQSVHSDRFVLRAQIREKSGAEISYALKVYSDDFGQRVWAFAQTLARHHPANHDGFCLPTAYLADERMLIFPWVDGKFLSEIVDERKPGLLRRAARLAAGLHRLRMVPDDLTTAQMFVEEARARCDRLRDRWPQTAELVEPLTAALQEGLAFLDPAEPAPIQGDMAAGQFLWTGTQLVLLDLDMFGYTDPAYDAGHFLAQLERRCLLDPTVRPHAREWLAAFRDTYLAAMPEVSPRNISFYQGLTLVRKIYTICRRQPMEGPHLAPLLAGRARAALEAVRSKLPAVSTAIAPRPQGPADHGPNGPARRMRSGRRVDEPTMPPAHAAAGPPPAPRAASPPKDRRRFRQILLAHLLRVRWRLAFAALCTLGVAAADLLKPWPLKIIIDHALLDKRLPHWLGFLPDALGGDKVFLVAAAAVGIVSIALASGLFSYSQIFITSSLGYRMVYSLRRELFAHLQRLSLSFHNYARSGDLMTRMAGDTNTLKDLFAESILKFATQTLEIAGMFTIMLLLNWRVGLVALATLPLLLFSLFHLYRKTKASVKKQKRQESQVASRMTEVLSAIPLVQAFAREQYEERKFDEVTAATEQESIRVARLEAAATRSSQIITAFGTAAAVLFGALQVLRGNMLPGELVLVASYLNSIHKPLRQMAKLSSDFSKAMASADRISEVLDLEPEIQDLPGAIEAPPLRGRIAFENVSFHYGDGREVVKSVSFTVSPGQRLALVGASGAGKSTLASLILRLYEPQQGAILIDGVDIRHYRRESLRRQIAIVLQSSILFGATVRENIAYGKPEAGDDEILAAAKAANADEFIRELPGRYDAVIGERGATLSGGQRQRIAIARALIRDAPILILDEPMTGLDVESEAKVREALDRLMAGRSCLMITHDLQAIANADLVLVIEAGEIVERGRHDELTACSGRYRQLYELNLQPPPPEAAG